jgi:rhodanese-related sulfurtransferase
MFSFFKGNSFSSVNANELDSILKKINLIDVRESHEYKCGCVPTAKNIPLNSILESPEKHLDKSKEYHIICQAGGRSTRVCKELASKGYQVVNVSGGTGSYGSPLQK